MSWFTKAGLNTIVLLRALWCQLWGACSRGSLHHAVLHSLHFPPIWRWCSTLPRKIHTVHSPTGFPSIIRWHKNQSSAPGWSDGCQSRLYFAILVFEWRDREQRSQIYLWLVYCREFRSTIKSGLKVCWMLLNTFQIYLKTNSNCFRDKYANGRKT